MDQEILPEEGTEAEAPDVPKAADVPESTPIFAPTPPPAPISARGVATGLGIAGLLAMVALQIFTLIGLGNANARIEDLQASVGGLPASIDDMEAGLGDRIDSVDLRIDNLDTTVEALGSGGPSAGGEISEAPASVNTAPVGTGALPAFESSQNDVAVGITLGAVSGPSYYDGGTNVSYGPDDGVARVWLIWAHWCPFCQQELPGLATWWADNEESLENVDLISVTTSIDPERGNPLEGYLDELALPFPVIVDEDLSLARQFGTTAFPYWIFTDQNGVVVGRAAGLLDITQVESIFTQLEALAGQT